MRKAADTQSGFALVLTLTVLVLLVLAVLGLSTLAKVSSRVSTSALKQTQARQNALLALDVGLGELQRHAGEDSRVTGMAGITNILPNLANRTRHWCGVWDDNGNFIAWLTSGARQPIAGQQAPATLETGAAEVLLVANSSVGAAASNSEHIIAGKIPVFAAEMTGAIASQTEVGRYAYVVIDEGVKTSAYSPEPRLVTSSVIYSPYPLTSNAPDARSRLRDALKDNQASAAKLLSFEQLALLPSPASPLTASTLQDNFHHVTLTNFMVQGAQLKSGMFNVNTNSIFAWRNLLQTYNSIAGSATMSAGLIENKSADIQGTLSLGGMATFSGEAKKPNGPFTSVVGFFSYLATLFPADGTPSFNQIKTAIQGMLTVRSDTFRIRGYGEALNPIDPAKVEASSYCEAVVQRVPQTDGSRRFVIVSFRWLGPDDI